MIVWRLVKTRHAERPLSTDGAQRYGGHWNPVGMPVLYCSDSLALAALEVLVHVRAGMRTVHYHAAGIEIPDGSVAELPTRQLPPTWREIPCDPAAQDVGAAWARSARSLALAVPSVIVPSEHNIVLNARHPEFARVHVVQNFAFSFDPRLTPAA